MSEGNQPIDQIVCPASRQHPRQDEASILPFGDGRLLLAYTDFYGACWQDNGPARICGRWSRDEGQTWSDPFVLQENIGRLNVMEASLLRLPSGRILLAFGRKDGQPGVLHCMVKHSDDEGQSWSQPADITRGERYWCLTHDRLVRLSGGRILFPVGVHGFGCLCWFSDDDGATWQISRMPVVGPADLEYAEPAVVELASGQVAMFIRNRGGNLHVALSDDGDCWRLHRCGRHDMAGLTNTGPSSAHAPCIVKRVPGTDDLLLIWNNHRMRTPLTAAVSRDGGETWQHFRNLEEMREWPPRWIHSYPSLTFLRGNAHVTYLSAELHPEARRPDGSGDPDRALLHLHYRRLPIAWFYEEP